jgi:hypothetical protein
MSFHVKLAPNPQTWHGERQFRLIALRTLAAEEEAAVAPPLIVDTGTARQALGGVCLLFGLKCKHLDSRAP